MKIFISKLPLIINFMKEEEYQEGNQDLRPRTWLDPNFADTTSKIRIIPYFPLSQMV